MDRGNIYNGMMIIGRILGCHQLPERSFFYHGKQFPVCSRCTGLFVGYAISVFMAVLGIRILLAINLLLLIPILVDWLMQYLGVLASNNMRRLITGIIGGTGWMGLNIQLITMLISMITE